MASWNNRIVGHGMESPDQLLAHPGNWRIHPKHQQDALLGVLEDVGFVQNIIVNKMTNTVVDGHLRVALALRHDVPEVPVVYVELSEDEEKLILATIDPVSALAVADAQKLDDLLQDVNSDSEAVQQMLDRLAAQSGLYNDFDYDEHWQGMPEFEQDDLRPYRSLLIHFDNQQDLDQFAQLIEGTITEKTKSVWYPKQKESPYKGSQYIDEP